MRIFATILITLYMCTTVSAADVAAKFAAGAEAYDGGRYSEAFSEWHALAEAGDIRAQVAIANMYRFGEGRPLDFAAAARWYKNAADAGNPIAQLNYAEMLETGRGVSRDRMAALMWYSRAARQGNAWAAVQRDRLAAKARQHRLRGSR
jgi:TPR repeat protein